MNLAAAYALAGKKVALLEFDLRQPTIHNSLAIDNAKGITTYLSGEETYSGQIRHEVDNISGLHVYTSGPIPSNPADLLFNDNLKKLFASLNDENYDFIIIDSPSAELVSDAFVLSEYADIAIFVMKKGVSSKTQIDFINKNVSNGKFKTSGIILNWMKAGKKNSYHG